MSKSYEREIVRERISSPSFLTRPLDLTSSYEREWLSLEREKATVESFIPIKHAGGILIASHFEGSLCNRTHQALEAKEILRKQNTQDYY